MIKLTETITAISTAMSDSGIGIVRMSGPEAFEIADRIYKGKKQLSSQESHTVHYGWIKDGEDTIDEVLVILMRGPHSYTGEDTVEINCHGGVFVVRKILETVLKNGARAAEPGEFTKRAFLNGRMDLSRAEAVIDVIHSKNEFALKNSVSQLRGSIQRKIQAMRDEILYHTAYIESALDDPEHISLDGYAESLVEKTEKLLKELKKLINTADNGRKIQEGIRTVIVGKPNAGKSSLLNVLVGEDRAIVTDIEGTTRDILEEHIQLNQAEEADLIIFVVDASRNLDENDFEIMRMIEDKNVIVLLNKSDLKTMVTPKMVKEHLDKPMIEISAKEEEGIYELEQTVKEMFFQGGLTFNDEVYITNVRQKEALLQAFTSLSQVKESIESGMPEDFYTIDLMDAYEALGNITGETIGEDLVNEIFSKFCMGK